LALAPGCGGESLGPVSTPVSDGTEVSPQRYVAATAAAAAAVAAFSRDLAGVGAGATRPALQRTAPALRASLSAAAVQSQRLSAERLEDARLEEQRSGAAAALATVVSAMTAATEAAEGGRPALFVRAVDDYSNAVAALRAAGQAP
jgi:hypothetical protein